MANLALLQSLKEGVFAQANVKALHGEPITAHAHSSCAGTCTVARNDSCNWNDRFIRY